MSSTHTWISFHQNQSSSLRGIAWRPADSLMLRQFLSIGLAEKTPDHVTISRTRRLIDGEIHQRIFTWVLEQLAQAGLIKGKIIGVDSSTVEANAAMKSIVRRDTCISLTRNRIYSSDVDGRRLCRCRTLRPGALVEEDSSRRPIKRRQKFWQGSFWCSVPC
jgi:hypothetical protein